MVVTATLPIQRNPIIIYQLKCVRTKFRKSFFFTCDNLAFPSHTSAFHVSISLSLLMLFFIFRYSFISTRMEKMQSIMKSKLCSNKRHVLRTCQGKSSSHIFRVPRTVSQVLFIFPCTLCVRCVSNFRLAIKYFQNEASLVAGAAHRRRHVPSIYK